MSNLTRKYKISFLTKIQFTDFENKIIDILKNEISELKEFKHDDYPLTTYYFNKSKLVLQILHGIECIYCRYDLYNNLRIKNHIEDNGNNISVGEIGELFLYFINNKLSVSYDRIGATSMVIINNIEKLYNINSSQLSDHV